LTALCNIKGTNYAPSKADNGLCGESLRHAARIPLGKVSGLCDLAPQQCKRKMVCPYRQNR